MDLKSRRVSNKRKTVKVVRKGKTVDIALAVHEFNQRKKAERLARKKLASVSNRLK